MWSRICLVVQTTSCFNTYGYAAISFYAERLTDLKKLNLVEFAYDGLVLGLS